MGKQRYQYETSTTGTYHLLKEFAQKNRTNPTEAESILWNLLRGKQLNVRFRRQHPIGNYIADFVCLQARLIIEVDGEYHFRGDMPENDQERTRKLNGMGYTVMRFLNDEIIIESDRVVLTIKNKLEEMKVLESSPLGGDKRGVSLQIAVLSGDGIGPEIMEQGVKVMSAVCEKFGHEVSYKEALCGAHAIDEVGDPFPEETFQTCMEADAVLFASVGDPKFDNNPNAKVRPEQGLLAMRKKLGLFANIRPVETFDCLIHKSPLKDELVRGADFICIRELTGGMYFGEKKEGTDVAYDTNYYTRKEVERILRVAYQYAMQRRKHLTVVDKANVLASSRLWRAVAQEIAPQYPDVKTDYMYVDNAAMRMIQEPTFFDVMVTENTFGDILTDEGSCITGSMGLLPSASTGEHTPVFEPIHGSWPQAKGLNIANPLAQILSVAMLFEYFDLKAEGALIREAVNASLDANVRTPEIQVEGGAKYGTKEVGQWIVDYIKAK
jgi:3-isopropylmalate dehydrogenase